ncbi:hypothetical protein DICSQDRAFT_128514 [Dichomitus squalens LYAD-421 SS1]|uniref:Uncharacterized protein n=1 Tax=Dichomitus squalens (strain LYAD-421) TaxID=732165 RepID=R7ST24_DICSQ|nr:uncharacterized protein DICSQDRAFT_128514 [Dichomitus squalens LYAD-421 SS1]EJF59093.1 hypothetical protein DICSQDRAFT_128514 [Dichomitus squalens LYAD-421 SS1]
MIKLSARSRLIAADLSAEARMYTMHHSRALPHPQRPSTYQNTNMKEEQDGTKAIKRTMAHSGGGAGRNSSSVTDGNHPGHERHQMGQVHLGDEVRPAHLQQTLLGTFRRLDELGVRTVVVFLCRSTVTCACVPLKRTLRERLARTARDLSSLKRPENDGKKQAQTYKIVDRRKNVVVLCDLTSGIVGSPCESGEVENEPCCHQSLAPSKIREVYEMEGDAYRDVEWWSLKPPRQLSLANPMASSPVAIRELINELAWDGG